MKALNKKINIIIFCFAAFCLICGTWTFGAVHAQTHPDSTNLINPTSICVDKENNLFIADETGDTAVIYRFTAKDRSTVYEGKHSALSRIRYGGGKIFGIYDNTLLVIDNIVTMHSFKIVIGNSNEKLVGIDANDDYLFCLIERTSNKDFIVCRIPVGSIDSTLTSSEIINFRRFELEDATDISVNSSTIFILRKKQGQLARYGIESTVSSEKTPVSENVERVYAYTLGNGSSAYMLFNNTSIDGNEVLFNGKPMEIADIAYFNKNNLYILDTSTNNGLKMVARFDFETTLKQIDAYVGSNSLKGVAPLSIKNAPTADNIRLARVDGYPSNIVYTVDPDYVGEGEGKIPENLCMKGHVLESETLFLILNYNSATDYYFIFYNVRQENGKTIGQNGWIEKTQAVVVDEASLSSNVFENCEQLGQSMKIYSLPSTASEYAVQSFNNDPSLIRQKVTVIYDLWEFDTMIGAVKWKYVSCDGKPGFVLASEIRENRDQSTAVRVKANPPFGKNLPLYQSRDKNSAVIATLRSGEDILLIKNMGDIAFVSAYVDGAWLYGYIDSSMFIAKGLTNNQALGITLSVAVILLAGFITFVLVRRHKVNKKETEPAGI